MAADPHSEPARTSGAGATLIFSPADLDRFSRASGDRNPLHLSLEYARTTSYGQPLVFGCLGGLACLGVIALPEGWAATALVADFLRPMITGVPYRVSEAVFEGSEEGGQWRVFLFDGSVALVSLTLSAAPTQAARPGGEPRAARFQTAQAAPLRPEQITPGLAVAGEYACDPSSLLELSRQWHTSPALTALFCFASYLVGMEVPGEQALFSKLALTFAPLPHNLSALGYRAEVTRFDARFNKAQIQVALSQDGSVLASGHCWSFIRPSLEALPSADADPLASAVRSDSLAGRTAVLIGATRGLGAALRGSLSRRGAEVFALSRSGTSGANDVAGSAADPASVARLRQLLESRGGRLDYLVCNAFPSILSLRLEPNAASRLAGYIADAVAMTLTPMCGLLDLLDRSAGCLVLVSSTVVDDPVQEWPHYAAAKAAVEMLARTAPLQYPRIRCLIVRPSKLLTGFTNTPVKRLGALPPQRLAEQVVAQLEDAAQPAEGTSEIISWRAQEADPKATH